MVDFRNDTTITRPRADILLFHILERRQDTIDAYRDYKEIELKGGGSDPRLLAIFQSRLLSLAEEIRPMLSEAIKKEEEKFYTDYYDLITDIQNEVEDSLRAMHYIDSLLYSKKITQVDSREIVDKYDIWGKNRDTLGIRKY